MGKLKGSRKKAVPMAETCTFSDGRSVLNVVEAAMGATVSDARILNHHGLLSLKVTLTDGRALKVAECVTEERAELAEQALQAVFSINGPVPRLYSRSGNVLIAQWVEGTLCSEEGLPRQAELLLACQRELYETPVSATAEARPIHLEHLASRLQQRGARVMSRARIDRVLHHLWRQLPVPDRVSVIHPDVTPVNVVICEGKPVIIDNEVIGLGTAREFDVWHTAESLYGHWDEASMAGYVSRYHALCPTPAALTQQSLWSEFRRLRRGLKAIEKRRYLKAARLLWSLPYR